MRAAGTITNWEVDSGHGQRHRRKMFQKLKTVVTHGKMQCKRFKTLSSTVLKQLYTQHIMTIVRRDVELDLSTRHMGECFYLETV